MADTHEMTLSRRLTSSEEHWVCTSCARQILVSWTPRFRTTVLEDGDERTQHVGGKGGATLATVSVNQTPTRMARAWLLASGIDWDGLAEPEARSA